MHCVGTYLSKGETLANAGCIALDQIWKFEFDIVKNIKKEKGIIADPFCFMSQFITLINFLFSLQSPNSS
jgi:hypothetical protein